MAGLENSLKKLDRLTQEEARMALAEVLRITHSVRDEVKVVHGKVESVKDKMADIGDNVADMDDKVEEIGDKVEDIGDKLEDMGDKVEDIGDKVEDMGIKVENLGDKAQCLDEKIEVVINGVSCVFTQQQIFFNTYISRRTASKRSGSRGKSEDSTGDKWHRRNQVFVMF